MRAVLWMIHDNLGNDAEVAAMREILDRNEIPVHAFSHVPFSASLPDVAWDGPVLCYGATRFITNVHRAKRWFPGAFFDEDAFTVARYIERFGDHCLNADAEVTSIAAFCDAPPPPSDIVFLRPLSDLKEFAGTTVAVGEAVETLRRAVEVGEDLTPETGIVVAAPKRIDAEWRTFIVDGRVSTASRYRRAGRSSPSNEVPGEILDFATEMARRWSPVPAFTLDVALCDGRPRVIELGCVNSAGFYAADLERLVLDLTSLAESLQPPHA